MKQYSVLILLILLVLTPLFAQKRSAEVFKRQALSHMKLGRYKEAIDELNKYITYKPQEPEGYNLRALCYEAQQRYHWARLDYRRAISLDPKNTEYRNNLSRIIKIWYPILEKNIEGYKRNIAINPNNPVNYLKIGKAYREMEKWSLAEHWYDEYLKRDDNASPDEIIRFSIILQKTGHIRKGERILKKWVERYPEDWRLWSRYGYFTLWLGKFKNAEHAFKTALGFKPFFKEAEDGLDLATKQGYVTQFQPNELDNRYRNRKPQEYAIDKYYRMVRINPNNDEARFKLVNLLLEKRRFEEAKQQLKILKRKYSDTERFKRLEELLRKNMELYYSKDINENLTKIKENPKDSTATFDLVKKYISLGNLQDAEEILREYLKLSPDDLEANYLLATILLNKGDKQSAYGLMKKVMELGGNKLKYKLLTGELGVWTLSDLDISQNYLNEVVLKEPRNIQPHLALSLLFYSKDNLDSMKVELQKAAALDSTNSDYLDLKSMYELLKLKKNEEHYVALVNSADSLMRGGNYEDAIPKYREYLDNIGNNKNVLLSLGNAYLMNNDYKSALKTFDELEQIDPSYDTKLLKAKVLFWSGDSIHVVKEFKNLLEDEPDNAELKVYLGDSYFRQHKFNLADSLYRAVPDSLWRRYKIDERISWLPPDKTNRTFISKAWYNLTGNLLSYLYLNPNVYYFNDNLNFTYLYAGIGGETGLLSFLSVGGSWRSGLVSDGSTTNKFQRVLLNLNLILSKHVTVTGGLGKLFSPNNYPYNHPVYELNLRYKRNDNLQLNAYFLSSEAVVILYSPYLLPVVSSTAHLYKFVGKYDYHQKLYFEGEYSILEILQNAILGYNLGNQLDLRIGKNFMENLNFGYEFEYIDYKFSSSYYYSPQEYSSHSIFGNWNFYKDDEWKVSFYGKIGYVPQSSFVIWDARLQASYQPYENMIFTGFASLRQSQRYDLGYRSKAFGISLSWSVF